MQAGRQYAMKPLGSMARDAHPVRITTAETVDLNADALRGKEANIVVRCRFAGRDEQEGQGDEDELGGEVAPVAALERELAARGDVEAVEQTRDASAWPARLDPVCKRTHAYLAAGVPSDVVKKMGQWSSDAFLRYWRSMDKIINIYAKDISGSPRVSADHQPMPVAARHRRC